jgi:hypothetical protein
MICNILRKKQRTSNDMKNTNKKTNTLLLVLCFLFSILHIIACPLLFTEFITYHCLFFLVYLVYYISLLVLCFFLVYYISLLVLCFLLSILHINAIPLFFTEYITYHCLSFVQRTSNDM